MKHYLYFAAEPYSCDAYGAASYGECLEAPSAAPDGGLGGVLSNTGYSVLIPLAIGLAIVIASVILLVKKLRRRTK